MWIKYLFLVLLFYFLGLLQFSFFAYFSILGIVPNFIFILFFLLLFFNRQNKFFALFSAVTAGFFIDVFSNYYFGSSIISLLIISYILEKFLLNLKETNDKYPLNYFVLGFTICFVIYELFMVLIFYFLNHLYPGNLGWIFLIQFIYNLIFAIVAFFVYKKIG